MRIFTFPIVIIIFSILSCNLYSQKGLHINFALLIPVLNYASIDTGNVFRGGASAGIGTGFQYLLPISKKGLNLFAGVEIFYNTYDIDAKNVIEKYTFQLVEITNPDFVSSKKISNRFSKMINIPVSAGMNYIFKSYDRISFFGSAGGTLNIIKCTDYIIVAISPVKVENFVIKTDPQAAIGGKFGIGMLVNNKTTITASYTGLFKYDMIMNCEGGELSHKVNHVKNVDFANISIGFKF